MSKRKKQAPLGIKSCDGPITSNFSSARHWTNILIFLWSYFLIWKTNMKTKMPTEVSPNDFLIWEESGIIKYKLKIQKLESTPLFFCLTSCESQGSGLGKKKKKTQASGYKWFSLMRSCIITGFWMIPVY